MIPLAQCMMDRARWCATMMMIKWNSGANKRPSRAYLSAFVVGAIPIQALHPLNAWMQHLTWGGGLGWWVLRKVWSTTTGDGTHPTFLRNYPRHGLDLELANCVISIVLKITILKTLLGELCRSPLDHSRAYRTLLGREANWPDWGSRKRCSWNSSFNCSGQLKKRCLKEIEERHRCGKKKENWRTAFNGNGKPATNYSASFPFLVVTTLDSAMLLLVWTYCFSTYGFLISFDYIGLKSLLLVGKPLAKNSTATGTCKRIKPVVMVIKIASKSSRVITTLMQ